MSISNTTIFAPSTLVGESGLTVIRISGPESFSVLAKIFSKKANKIVPIDFSKENSHTVHHGYIHKQGELVDEAVVTVFKAPNSFTGEDVAELSTHGGSHIFRKISILLVNFGIEHASPGEFSKRAYLNGRMDLAQAEAVADLIRAKTDASSKLALKQLTGEFSKRIAELREMLINYCSLLELELDFSEEGLVLVSKEELLDKIDSLIEKFKRLTASFESGKIIKNGVNLAIVGKPNVGKSSIFNYLLNESRAIVSEIPGTTRDYLQEPLIMGGIVFNIIDTAGIRQSNDIIEQEGVRRSKKKMEEADIVLEVEDITDPGSNGDVFVVGVPDEKIIKVLNKSDLGRKLIDSGLDVSTLTGSNMDRLKKEIVERVGLLVGMHNESDIIVTNERHRDCLSKSCEYLVNAKTQISQNAGNELISIEIRAAMDSVGEIVGTTRNVDILNNIFAKFCIGK